MKQRLEYWSSPEHDEWYSLHTLLTKFVSEGTKVQTVIPLEYYAPTLTGRKYLNKALIIINED